MMRFFNKMNIKYLTFIFLISFSGNVVFAQQLAIKTNNPVEEKTMPLFKKGDRVCFVGNSITHNGEFYQNIFQYYVTRFPTEPISFFNCGISGDVTTGVIKRIDSDIMIHNPTYVVIMIGMNDVNRNLYGSQPTLNADTLNKQAQAIRGYKSNLESLVKSFLAKGVKVILQKPSIYDQTAQLPRANNFGVNDALKSCADFMGELAVKYNLQVVDYWSILSKINQEVQKKDPKATVIGADRVHPGPTGHLIMAYQFLKTFQASKYVSHIKYDVKKDNLKFNQGQISFSVLEKSLPFPKGYYHQEAYDLLSFNNELNVELLQVNGLPNAQYTLYIDEQKIDAFTASQLKQGINLATYMLTPQYKQSMEVRKQLSEYWKTNSSLRTIDFVEIKHLANFTEKDDMEAVSKHLDKLLANGLSSNGFFKIQFDKYKEVKPQQEELQRKSKELWETAYATAKPVSHTFKLTKN